MLGFQDAGALSAFLLTIAAVLVCVVYGVVNWNKPSPDQEKREVNEELEWEKHDPDLGPASSSGKGKK